MWSRDGIGRGYAKPNAFLFVRINVVFDDPPVDSEIAIAHAVPSLLLASSADGEVYLILRTMAIAVSCSIFDTLDICCSVCCCL